jgi:hypothetical protein
MENQKLIARINHLELLCENLEGRIDEHDNKFHKAAPVLTQAANQNVLFWSAVAITILNLLLLLLV